VAEQPVAVNESPVVEEESTEYAGTEYSDAEKTAILEAMNETESETSVVEAEERRAIMEAMVNESDDEISTEERKAILNAMQ
jgi:hypothetical protein